MGIKIGEVFTAGGTPNITYYARDNLKIESRLKKLLKAQGKIISITGPTKSGKSVLCKKIIPPTDSIWVMGAHIKEENDLWRIIVDKLGISLTTTQEESEDETTTLGGNVSGTISVKIVKLQGSVKQDGAIKKGIKTVKSFNHDSRVQCIDFLLENGIPLLIDDFHYIDPAIQKDIIRSLKNAVSDGLKVILIAVPHREYDSIKVEQEMNGRVSQIRVTPWNAEELSEIAKKGFKALNINYPEEIVTEFTKQSFRSPHLMQEFCFYLCLENDFEESRDTIEKLNPPNSYEDFFEEIVETSTSNVVFEKLVSGPTSKDRKERHFKNGRQGDIYEAVMATLTELDSTKPITSDDIRKKLQDILETRSVPQKHEITRVLTQMDKIAKEELIGEPAIDFKDDALYIVDPFFIFYLRWANLY
ncbi:hypothetical protein CN887_21025 [Bacillus pseudomycoides]|uniref:hypothetical protein n=1 Tax=Bacillus pseudomycoides TaxID=64104 RepID=UPI000BEFFF2C|nr:hypothetical protein [Bacillus pseudomycoides]PEJ23197.1 hypothetical protein CN887_21025 [Bacillus pseudomycoides]